MAFQGIKINPRRKRKFDPSIIAVLRKTLTRIKRNHKSFSLCSPPTELVDMLKLTGTLDQFEILGEKDKSSRPRPGGFKSPRTPDLPTRPTPVDPAQRKMRILNQSLHRTVKLEKGLDYHPLRCDRECRKYRASQSQCRAYYIGDALFFLTTATLY